MRLVFTLALCLGLTLHAHAEMSQKAKEDEFRRRLCIDACGVQAEYVLGERLRGSDVLSSYGEYPRCWDCELHRKDGSHYRLGRPGRRLR
jgi:hypothetical protein